MSIEADIRTYLLAQPAISALIGARMHPLRLPQGETLPAVTYQVVFGTRLVSHDGATDLGRRRVQFDCWADRYADMVAVADAVKAAIAGYAGPMGGTVYTVSETVNDLDIAEPEPTLWRRLIEAHIWHREQAG